MRGIRNEGLAKWINGKTCISNIPLLLIFLGEYLKKVHCPAFLPSDSCSANWNMQVQLKNFTKFGGALKAKLYEIFLDS